MIARDDKTGAPSGPRAQDIWARLAMPTPADAIQWRIDGKPIEREGRLLARFVAFADAQFVRQRLDEVVPGEWDLTFDQLPTVPESGEQPTDEPCAFKARLQILGVIREDMGQGSDYKNAATDAFKRAAMRFGIAHDLWSLEQNWVEVEARGKYFRPLEDPAIAYQRRYGRDAGVTDAAARLNEQAMAKKNGGQAGPNRAWLEEAIATKGALTLDEVHYVTGVLAKPDYEDADLASLVIRIRTAQQRRAEGSASSQVVPTSTSPAPEPRARAADATPPSERTPSCPKCGGRMWDNRLSKRNPKAPDFKCRDRSCDGVIWPPRPAEERRDEPPAYAGDPGPDDLPPALDSSPLGMAIDDIPF